MAVVVVLDGEVARGRKRFWRICFVLFLWVRKMKKEVGNGRGGRRLCLFGMGELGEWLF